ncbi:MAG: hypothetical protein ACRECH_08365 [Nitrososphaerales archaeon]
MPDLAPTAAPINALKCWTNGRSIFVELPGPWVTSYPLTEGGLSRALSLLVTQKYDFGGGVMLNNQTPVEALAESILRRKGLI